jgi:hypothetical protein
LIKPLEFDDRPRSARTAAGVRFAPAEQMFQSHPAEPLDSVRPRTAVSRVGGVDTKEAKKFTFSAEGCMSDWQTTAEHSVVGTDGMQDVFPAPTFLRKAIPARSQTCAAVPPLNLAAIKGAPIHLHHDKSSSRHAATSAVSSSARSSSFTPRNSELPRQRRQEHESDGQDFLDSYRQVCVHNVSPTPICFL